MEVNIEAWDIHVEGIVQGVGFRPFIVRLAHELRVRGWVLNTVRGVDVRAWGEACVLEVFASRIESDAPLAALVSAVTVEHLRGEPLDSPAPSGFEIRPSDADGSRNTLVSPDLATCPDCQRELFDPADKRYRYPFINCTNCGPRFTIINDLPYDRQATSMAGFKMCPSCAAEYADVEDRRFHAQPDACFECGPRLWACESPCGPGDQPREKEAAALLEAALNETGECDAAAVRAASDALIAEAARRIESGEVIAVKGLGGWHLCCDTTNEAAVQTLRDRKHRPSKPLAVMVADLSAAAELVDISAEEEELLESPAHPIVLAPRCPGAVIARAVAGRLPELGVMLPSTPLQHLLLHAVRHPLVMTSGNRSGEPIVADDAEALLALGGIASWFLGNNREIVARYDDSVARVLADGSTQMVRRARGYAPAPLFLPQKLGGKGPVILAAGPEQKSTFCLLDGDKAFISQHLGDLETLGSWNAWQEARERYQRLFDLEPQVLACDMHPEYLSSKWAREQALSLALPLVEVQHHHAHIAAVMGENSLDGRVLGVALDGTGYGADGNIWGCEILLASRAKFERLWHLPTFCLPGGAAAIKDPRRAAYALLHVTGLLQDERFTAFLEALPNAQLLEQMIEKDLNCPLTSSAGRLFDATAALMGLCSTTGYDGEPACLLEAKAREELMSDGYKLLAKGAARVPHGNEQGLLRYVLVGDERKTPLTACGVHVRLAAVIIEECKKAREATGVNDVALGGGCMVNRLLFSLLQEGLREIGFCVYGNRELPPNDGCVAYGQAVVAQARLLEE